MVRAGGEASPPSLVPQVKHTSTKTDPSLVPSGGARLATPLRWGTRLWAKARALLEPAFIRIESISSRTYGHRGERCSVGRMEGSFVLAWTGPLCTAPASQDHTRAPSEAGRAAEASERPDRRGRMAFDRGLGVRQGGGPGLLAPRLLAARLAPDGRIPEAHRAENTDIDAQCGVTQSFGE